MDIQQQAIEICRLRLWLSLVVDYDLGCDPLNADEQTFRQAIRNISQLPNLEMNFRRGDSLLDMISGVHIRVDSDLLTGRSDEVREIQKLGHDLHKARNAEKKKKLRVEILRRRFDLSQRVLEDEKKILRTGQQVGDLFGGDEGSDAEKRRRAEAEIEQLDKALAKLTTDRKELEKLTHKPMAADFYRDLRKLEGADFDSPFNFVWRIDYAEIFTPKPVAADVRRLTSASAGETKKSQSLLTSAATSEKGGFDLIVGNPPFVTARNPVKRELYRARWKRVCHMKFLLVCPFFDLSFGLLKPEGQLGFIVSNAFAKREFGQPLIEDFFPTVDLQKVVDCSGLLFPGHGTPTCIVFGSQRKPDETKPIRVAATLPGGGDLRTPPEDSPLWHALSQQHDSPGYGDSRVVVTDLDRKGMGKWPWNFDRSASETKEAIEAQCREALRDFLSADIGFDAITAANDIFMLPTATLRRYGIPHETTMSLLVGEMLRNYEPDRSFWILWPYSGNKIESKLTPPVRDFLKPFRSFLEVRSQFHKTQLGAGLEWFEFREYHRRAVSACLTYAKIATHIHAYFSEGKAVFNEHAPVIQVSGGNADSHHLVASALNSSAALLWLKQICFNKGAGEEEQRDRFELQPGKIQQLPIPTGIADALRGKPDALAERLTALSRACWDRGREMPSLALRKMFEKSGEAYHAWNAALPGHVPPPAQMPAPFTTTQELREAFNRTVAVRQHLRAEMIALQEEMDWLVYAAYGLLPADNPAVITDLKAHQRIYQVSTNAMAALDLIKAGFHSATAVTTRADGADTAQENGRPFRLWAQADGDFAKAVALIPADWPKPRRVLWEARLAAIRDNEHIRRIEAPVYKRRWDEQWKVSNRWLAGPVAYAQELVDAFRWWLAERAEWHLEHKANGGPLSLDAWSVALASDARVQAAWPVIADALNQVELWKLESNGKKPAKPPQVDASSAAFTKFFRDTVNDETVPDGIPPAVPWEELEKKMKVPKQAKNVRGKLNVPRECFRLRDDSYIWAGKSK